MSERHELCAAAMRQYGTDPDGVERAMRAAGYSEITAIASRDTYADFLRKAGYDVDGPMGEDPPQWAVDMVGPVLAAPDVVQTTAEPVPSEPERTVDAPPEPPVTRPKRGRPRKG